MTGVTKEIMELYVYFMHRVAIANGYQNDTENMIAPLVADFIELIDKAYKHEFKYQLMFLKTVYQLSRTAQSVNIPSLSPYSHPYIL